MKVSSTIMQQRSATGFWSKTALASALKNCTLAAAVTLTAAVMCSCSSGGGSSRPPVQAPPPSPPPSLPPPPPPPTSMNPADFETAEYNRNPSYGQVGLSTAYASGGIGEGIKIAVVDTGIDVDHPEFSGRIDFANSRDIAGNRGINDEDGHGTFVAGVIAANKDGQDAHGVAFQSTILALRTETPNSCDDDNNCSFSDPNIAAAIDYAITQNVDIINLSLGGEVDGSQVGENALRRAADAGILVVVSAGNDGNASPDDPAYIAGQAASRDLIVAVGSLNIAGDDISDFSNRAGEDAKNFFILAPGEDLITPGLDDALFRVSGTSFAAPFVSGALALILDAFPNLTPAQALEIILTTADDLGAPGPDAIYGVGALNIEQAFAPSGTSSVSINRVDIPLTSAVTQAEGPFGDWLTNSSAFSGLVFQDSYQRGYRLRSLRSPTAAQRTTPLYSYGDYLRGTGGFVNRGPVSLSWFTPDHSNIASLLPYDLAPQPSFAIEFTADDFGFSAGRGGAPHTFRPSFSLVSFNQQADAQTEPFGLENAITVSNRQRQSQWARVSHSFAGIDFDLAAVDRDLFNSLEVGANFNLGASKIRLSAKSEKQLWANRLGVLSRVGGEDETSSTLFSADTQTPLFADITFSGFVEAGRINLQTPEGFSMVDTPWTSSWGASLQRPFGAALASIKIAQPRRAETGSLSFEGPVDMLRNGSLVYDTIIASLDPSGREIDFEASLAYSLSSWGMVDATAAYITAPAHIAGEPSQMALWLTYRNSW